MGNFSRDIRKMKIKPIGMRTVSLDVVKAQYNPYRFKHWQFLHDGPPEKVLDIAYSPHVRLLKQYEQCNNIWEQINQTPYFLLQQRYGRGYKWISEKVRGFLQLYNFLKKSNLEDDSHISVVERPIRKNPYNDGYEVFEGHHRIACLCVLGIEEIPVLVMKVLK